MRLSGSVSCGHRGSAGQKDDGEHLKAFISSSEVETMIKAKTWIDWLELARPMAEISGIDSWYFVGADNPSTWTDIEDGFDDVNIFVAGAPEQFRRKIEIDSLGTRGSQTIGTHKDDFRIQNGIIDVSWEIEYTLWERPTAISELKFLLYSYDDTLLVNLSTSFIGGSTFGLFASDGVHYQELRRDLESGKTGIYHGD